MTSVGISLKSEMNMASICVSDDRAARLETMQFTLGQGPSYDAFATGNPVLERQLASALPVRWPALTTLALDAGIEGIFAYPLQIGAARLGVLTAYQRSTNAWTPAQHLDALVAADALTHVILSLQARAPAGALADALRDAGSSWAEVHQASGMLSAQLGVSVAEALVWLRSRSYVTGTPIFDLAQAVIARRLRLERRDNLEIEWNED